MARRSLSAAIEADGLDEALGTVAVIQRIQDANRGMPVSKPEPNSTRSLQPFDQYVASEQIHLDFSFNSGQPLRYQYDEAELRRFAKVLEHHGIRNPLWVRPLPAHLLAKLPNQDGVSHYELVAGMRRFLASRYVGIEVLPVKIFDWSDAQALTASRAENFQRKEFTALEELDHILAMLSETLNLATDEVISLLYQMKNEQAGNTKSNVLLSSPAQSVIEVFEALGRMSWLSFIGTRLSLRNKPPEILAAIRSGKLDYTKGIELAKLKDADLRAELLEQTIEDGLSVEQVRAQVQQITSPQQNFNLKNENQPEFDQEDLPLDLQAKSVYQRIKRIKPHALPPKKQSKLRELLQKIEVLLAEAES